MEPDQYPEGNGRADDEHVRSSLQDKLSRLPDLATILTSPTVQKLGGLTLLSALASVTPDQAIIIHGG